ncbi:hypothetical protein HYFRA_00012123 [Hymenoscyphus fraxineus]|uniref:Uncharacterized protein n=1 Tax=Hymenoscyphus fraxineus TaxID=746836 RepID=A0A9N9L5K4_9HELO|nr:hypothetical protein HYFRA_00012123 [Hymenoscyphus fraxineus]
MMGGSPVYVGVWQNFCEHLVFGSTITLEESHGNILSNVLALLVQSAGQSFWTIISYIIHQSRNNRQSEHPLFYQQQSVLRNSGSALTAALRLSQLSFSWRKRTGLTTSQYCFRSTLHYIFVAFSISFGFALASVFSSKVTQFASPQVLLLPDDCGFYESRNYTNTANAKRALWTDAVAATYANSCYNQDTNLMCDTYMVKEINSTDMESTDVRCPFPKGVCNGTARIRDTKFQNTADILGVNTRASDRLLFRKRATCAPLNLGKYITKFNKTIFIDGKHTKQQRQEVTQIYLGGRGGDGIENTNDMKNGMKKFNPKDLTYEYFNVNWVTSPGYQLQAIHAETASKQYSDWKPIEGFNKNDSDTVVFIMSSSGIAYRSNITDPFFRANKSSGTDEMSFDGNEGKKPIFRPPHPITSIGCIDQYQICNPNMVRGDPNSARGAEIRGCTPLIAAGDIPFFSAQLELNSLQSSTAVILGHHLQESGIYNTVSSQGQSGLKAHGTSYTIEDTVVQVGNKTELIWQNEMDYWFFSSLASLQMNFVQMVTDKSDPQGFQKSKKGRQGSGHDNRHDNRHGKGHDNGHGKGHDKVHGKGQDNENDNGYEYTTDQLSRKAGFIRLNTSSAEDTICASQMVRIMDGYQNFSLIGIILIVFFSILLNIIAVYIHVIGGKIQQIVFGNPLARVSWTSDGYLQLQRMAYEGAGYEGWHQCATDDVPLLRDVEKLGGLDISDINHPRLLRATDLLDKAKSPSLEDHQNHQVPPLRDFSTLPPYTKELPLLPMLGVNLSNTVLDTRETHSAGQQREIEQDARVNDSTTIFTTFSGATCVQNDRPLPPLPLR